MAPSAFSLLTSFLCTETTPDVRANLLATIGKVQQLVTGKNTMNTGNELFRDLHSKFIEGRIMPSELMTFADMLSHEPDGALSKKPMAIIEKVLTHDRAGFDDLHHKLITPIVFGDSVAEGRDAAFERLTGMFLHRDMRLMEDRVAFIKFLGYDPEKSGVERSNFSLRNIDVEHSGSNDYLFSLVMSFIHGSATGEDWAVFARYLGFDLADIDGAHNVRQTHRIVGSVLAAVEFREFLERMRDQIEGN